MRLGSDLALHASGLTASQLVWAGQAARGDGGRRGEESGILVLHVGKKQQKTIHLFDFSTIY